MSVVRTDEWLLDFYYKPIEICKKIEDYFEGASAADIYGELTWHGMYCRPDKNGFEVVENLQKNNVWEIVQKEEQELRKLWSGPDIPIFILPSDTNSRRMKYEYNGKSGLAFKNKLFLFISENNTENEIRAILTHEYNHVCRLGNYQKNEEDYVLLDSIIMEGLAENAVRERIGEEFVAAWTAYYSTEELEKMWKNLMLPNRKVPRIHRKHHSILYGLRLYPKMAGYCVGYYLVEKYMKEKGLACKDLMNDPSEKIAKVMD
ncbi:Zn-dependent protease [Bacillus aerolatus]|uniref:Zn-dependent protease n=1 Tax=Bacillus aerolatus TaxID=2653354 RepID=A0A6I1FR81_9BACI|nr:DUF2268 domain-containing protein [Bacillus aerolatus]KAB7707078.1 Zn-dependent protease [Bacillus aerolatus]